MGCYSLPGPDEAWRCLPLLRLSRLLVENLPKGQERARIVSSSERANKESMNGAGLQRSRTIAHARSVRARTARILPNCTFTVAACTCIMHAKPRAMMLLYSTTFSFTRKRVTATALRGAETGHEAFMRLP